MSHLSADHLHDRVRAHLSAHGRRGVRTYLSGVVDLDALEDRRYGDVLESVDKRRSNMHYSLVSMIVAGIYFGLVIGNWLVGFATWMVIAQWALPVGLVTFYAAYATHQSLQELYHLNEARALLRVLADQPMPSTPSR